MKGLGEMSIHIQGKMINKLVITFILIILIHNIGYSQLDSLVIYHRIFCADYGRINNDINRIKDFGKVEKFVIRDKDRIKDIVSKLDRAKQYKGKLDGLSNGYLLGGYSYRKGQEELLFVISTYKRLTVQDKVYTYRKSFLDCLLGEKPPCYYP